MNPSRGDDGYTLAEMLAALAIIGLALGGLLESMNAIHRAQLGAARGIADAQDLARVRRDMARLFAGQGPFASDDKAGLAGDAVSMAFDCGAGHCAARLTADKSGSRLVVEGPAGWSDQLSLPGLATARFVYADSAGQVAAWPPSAPEGGQRRKLLAVALAAGDAAAPSPLATARLWLEQTPDCQFDMISEDCRSKAG